MKIIIHDLTETALREIFPLISDEDITDEDIIISENNSIHPCIGCFGCWLKTPGECIIKDTYRQMGRNLAMCSEMVIVSQCVYGGYSPFVKNILDRSISYIHPYFAIINGEMHHQQRYKKDLSLRVFFYGNEITNSEKEIAEKLPAANAVNFYGKAESVTFLDSLHEMEVPRS